MKSSRIQLLNKQNIVAGKYVLLLARCIHRHNLAQRKFLLEGLNCLKNSLSRLHAPLLVVKASSDQEATEVILKLSEVACEVITDAAYLREDRTFEENLNDKLVMKCRRLTKVEGNVTIPVTVLCNKPAYNANTIRKVAWHLLDDFLHEEWNVTPKVHCESWKSIVEYNLECIDISLEHIRAVNDCKTSSKLEGGEVAAHAFLEELVVRRELAHNFVYYYRATYDTFDCLPEWVKKTMDEHRLDKREYIYSYKELEEGYTHDIYWNAAQFELVFTHKMSGYLRMYWAKKVIEWSPDYESAYAFLIEQNNKYELDGYDPNGYCGVIWNFGMHDRAHSNRPVFGKIRYMCADGIRRKFRNHIDEYVSNNYKRAGRTLKLNNHSQSKTTEALDVGPKLKKRRRTTNK
ncbi:unnamed protein product [Onchocerca flexuosa]|uniref:Deoxyribodipyrimidine photo-lyase n=1 Tax=Onchocerca flexuosa TaxID=387005 RepID=A0A183HY02_9BILA|nr:unnamed protein product [Onchocerca flexuosa]